MAMVDKAFISHVLHLLPLWIRDGKIVTDDLNGSSRGQSCPRIPAILIEGILYRYDREFFDKFQVQVLQRFWLQVCARIRFLILKVQVVLPIFVEFGGGNVHADFDLSVVTSGLQI